MTTQSVHGQLEIFLAFSSSMDDHRGHTHETNDTWCNYILENNLISQNI